MPDWILLLPIVFPLVGAVFFSWLTTRLQPRARSWLPMIFLVLQVVALLLNVAPGAHRLVVAEWKPAGFSIALQMDGVTQLLLLMMVAPIIALWLVAPPRKPFDRLPLLVLSAAILLTAAENLVTAYLAWSLLDFSILLWRWARGIERETALRSVVIGQFSGLVLFAGSIFIAAGQTQLGATLAALAFWARLGIFPFHYLLPTRGADAFDLWFARGIPIIAASNLWLHWSALRVDAPITLIGVLGGIVCIVSALWVWREESPARAIGISVSPAIALVPLTIAFANEASVAIALWLTLAVAAAFALFELALRWRADNLNRWHRLIWFAALFALAGFPLTPAFLGRVGVYVALWASGNWLLMLMAGGATLAALTPLWNFGFAIKGSRTASREPTRREYGGLTFITLVFLALAFAPMLIAHALAPAVGDSAERALDLVVRTNDVLGVAMAILTLAATVIGSFLLYLSVGSIRPRPDSFFVRLTRVLALDWLERLVVSTARQIGRIAQSVSTMAEANPTVWLLFVALWVAIFIMLVR